MTNGRGIIGLKSEVEQALGFRLAALKPLKGGSTLNFKARRADDGFPFLVKILSPECKYVFNRLVQHFEDMQGTCAAKRLFPEAQMLADGWLIFCMEWCEGEQLAPDRLSPGEIEQFLTDYLAISGVLQNARTITKCDPILQWREQIMAMRSRWARPIQRIIEKHIPSDEVEYRPEFTKVIYGDFHHGNFVFRDHRLYRLFDLEAFSYGYPAEDIVRYFVCAFEHLPLGGFGRRRSMLKAFAVAVKTLPYTQGEWLLAINALFLRKCAGYGDGEFSFMKALNLRLRFSFYLALRHVVEFA